MPLLILTTFILDQMVVYISRKMGWLLQNQKVPGWKFFRAAFFFPTVLSAVIVAAIFVPRIGKTVLEIEGVNAPKLTEVFIRNGVTGEVKLFPEIKGQDIAVGPGGEFYVTRMTNWNPGTKSIDRYDRDGDPLPLPGSVSNEIKEVPGNVYGHGYTGTKGLFVSPRGEIAVIDKSPRRGVSVYGPDGKLKTKKVIDGLAKGDGSPAIDAQGNVYIASMLTPPDWSWPKAFGDAAPAPTYTWLYGSVVKFPATGGHFYYPPPRWGTPPASLIWPPPHVESCTALNKFRVEKAYVVGQTWIRPGFSTVPGSGCGCYVGRFTVDRYGRVLIPDVGQFSVLVVDANNNELLRFGDYGNEDSAGPGSRCRSAWSIPIPGPTAGERTSNSSNRNRPTRRCGRRSSGWPAPGRRRSWSSASGGSRWASSPSGISSAASPAATRSISTAPRCRGS